MTTREEILATADYTQADWQTDTTLFYLTKNGLGMYWPKYAAKPQHGCGWCQVYIRDSNPFKTLKGAIRYVENYRKKWGK